ncbi:hypothetical protein D3C84_1108420 [compost metagenome]
MNHRNRAIRAVMRQQFGQDLLQMIDPQMNRHRRPVLRQAAKLFASGHHGFVGIAGQDHALRYVG